NMPLWQQSLGVMALIAVDVALVTWIHGILGTRSPSLGHWWPVVIGALFWPWVFLVLRDLRRRARVK
ncbi:MAG: rod shape-determining protein MreD, partial [Arenicellales bacterium]|nr:rod shape-determining protein MreD [Arenicellales bacterium]